MDVKKHKRLEAIIRGSFILPKGSEIDIREVLLVEGLNLPWQTRISIRYRDQTQNFIIDKPVDKIQLKDIRSLETPKGASRSLTLSEHVFRLAGLFGASTGLYAMSAVCPFCGSPHCAVGLGAASLFGGFFALLVHNWKHFFLTLRAWLTRFSSTNRRTF
jgi:hypothetical protein